MACRESYATTCVRYRARNPLITSFCCWFSETISNFVIQLIGVEVKELRDGLPERVLALHARPQEILANANVFHGGDLGWPDGAADQGFREHQRMELTERGI